MQQVLVLNASYEPLNVTTVRRAHVLVFKGKAEVIEELVIVDARRPERFRGEPNPIDQVPGRIPGALNAPWDEPPPDLPEGELVAYCGSGVTACVVLHRLALAGRDGRLYPGSWSEWEQLGLPVTRG